MALKRNKPLVRRTWIRRRSAKAIAAAPARDDVRWELFLRDRGRCFLVGIAGPCAGPWTPHHIEKAWKGSAYDLANLLTLCVRHNTWVEDNPDVAWSWGLVQRWGDTPEVCAARRAALAFHEGPRQR